MRKSLIIFLLIGGTALGLGIFNSLTVLDPAKATPVKPQVAGISEVFHPSPPAEAVSEPVVFSAPAIEVKGASVESVGLDDEGKMDVPKDADNVGWYNLGAKPGERGNAVMAGHLDKKDGSAAVFYDIKKLKPGDELVVQSKSGQEYKYVVTEVKTYDLDKFPLDEVFGVGDKARLNLITCEGKWDANAQLYSQRLVVYSELKL